MKQALWHLLNDFLSTILFLIVYAISGSVRIAAAVAVGVGALGSQVVQTLARSGFGRWTVVDEDDLRGSRPDHLQGPSERRRARFAAPQLARSQDTVEEPVPSRPPDESGVRKRGVGEKINPVPLLTE